MLNTTVGRRARRYALWASALLAVALVYGGCVSAPRPVPAGAEPVAQAQVGGVVLTVPRLDSGDFPGDVLDVSTAVLVVIENRGPSEIIVDPAAFTLGPSGGAQYSPIPAAQLAYKTPTTISLPEDTMLAYRGGGFGGRGGIGIGVRAAPRASVGVYRGGSIGGRLGHSYAPRTGYYRGPTWGGGYGRGYWPSYAWGGYYGYGGPYWGGNSYYDGRAYAWSRAEAQRLSLPSSRLPPGATISGFLFFPRMDVPEGTSLVLAWPARDAATGQVIGTAALPLELRAD